MAEHFEATLFVPKRLITPEIKALIKEYRKDFPNTEENEEDGIYYLCSPEARWGKFEEIEEALVEMEIPFDRETSSYDPDPAFTTYYRPGLTPEPKDVFYTIDVQDVRDVIKSGGLEALQKKLDEDYPEFRPLKEVQA